MGSREPFPPVSPGPPQNPQLDQQMRVSYTADGAYRSVGSPPPYPPMPGSTPLAMNLNSGDQKRKRGRPRKYGPDGNMSAMAMAPAQQSINVGMQSFSPPAAAGSASPTAKKARGRPPGSVNKKKQLEAVGKIGTKFSPKGLLAGSTGIGFIPHVIDVKPGEDVSSKIMAFAQNGPRVVCILSANGAISSVTLRQASTAAETATYQGRFDILSLSGSFMLSDDGQKRTGSLSTTLAGPDGRVFGGCVAGLLIASSPVLVIVGSFKADGQKVPKSRNYTRDPLSAQPKMTMGGPTGGSSSPSRGTFSESSGEPASPLNLSSGAYNNNHHPQGMSAMPWK